MIKIEWIKLKFRRMKCFKWNQMCNKLLHFENKVKNKLKLSKLETKIMRIQMKYAFRKIEK